MFSCGTLEYNSTTLLQHYNTTILQYYNTTRLQDYNTTIIQYYNTTIATPRCSPAGPAAAGGRPGCWSAGAPGDRRTAPRYICLICFLSNPHGWSLTDGRSSPSRFPSLCPNFCSNFFIIMTAPRYICIYIHSQVFSASASQPGADGATA